jgi:hypothetical protein
MFGQSCLRTKSRPFLQFNQFSIHKHSNAIFKKKILIGFVEQKKLKKKNNFYFNHKAHLVYAFSHMTKKVFQIEHTLFFNLNVN